jgi:hypothetical protein
MRAHLGKPGTEACENLAALFSLDSNDRQRKAQPQFLLQINLHVVQAELLKLDAAKIMNVGRVAFHFFEFELDLGLRQNVLLVDAHDARSLLEFPGAAAPTRPNAESHVIDRERRRSDHVEHADQSVHPVELATNVLAQHAALQIGENRLGRFHRCRS